MKKYILKRIMISACSLIVMMVILFLLLTLMPGSPFNDAKLDAAQKAVIAAKYGLDKPVLVRLWLYMKNVIKGDFGVSYVLSRDYPVSELLTSRIGVSVGIGFCSLLLGTVVGIALGLMASVWEGRLPDHLAMGISVLGLAAPAYVFAVLFCYYLGFKWRMFPLIYDLRAPLTSATLPILASSVMIIAVISRFTRDETLRVMQSDYVLFARCQGMDKKTLIFGYVLRNALLPVVTVMGSLVVSLLTGTLVIEDMFAVPGIGSFMGEAILENDYNVVLALSFVYAMIYIVVMLGVDIIYGILDPRIRIAGKAE